MISCKRKVQYYETDKMGIVHHSNYIRFFEEGCMNFFDKIGYNFREIEETGITRPVVSVEAKYMEPLRFDDEFEVRTYVEEYTAATFTFYYEVVNSDKVCAKGRTKHCFMLDGRPVNLKKAYPDFLNRLEEHKKTK